MALALAGGGLGVHALLAPGDEPRGDVVRRAAASFGPVAVERVERTAAGTAPHDGAHAGPSATRADEVAVTVHVENRLPRALPYSPGQFRLRLDGAGTTVTAANPNPPPASIPARGGVRHRLRFLVPERAASLSLVFQDVGRPRPVTIELGRVR